MAYYLFNFTRKEGADESRPHREQAAELLQMQLWGIGPKATNRELLAPGDQILAYIGSEFLFIGSAVLSSGVHDWTPEEAAMYPGSLKGGVGFKAFAVWKMPVPLRSAALARGGGMPSFGGQTNPQLFGSILPIEREDFDRVVSVAVSQSAKTKPQTRTILSDAPVRAIPSDAPSSTAVTDQPEAPAAAPTVADHLSDVTEAPEETTPPAREIPSDVPAQAIPSDAAPQAIPDDAAAEAISGEVAAEAIPSEAAAEAIPSEAPMATAVTDKPATPAAPIRLFDWRAGDVWVESRPPAEAIAPTPPATEPAAEVIAPTPPATEPATEQSPTLAPSPTTADRLYAVAERLNRFLAEPADALSEEATKAHFVTPFLVALGYTDFSDIAFGVPIESGEIADYVVSATDEPTIVVETWKLGTRLGEQEAAQVVEDASVLGVRWGLVTDGRQIKVFDAHAPNIEPEERLVFEVDLGDYSDREDFDAQIYPDLALLAKSEMQAGGEGLTALAAELDRSEEASAALIAQLVEEHLEQTFRLQLVANLREIFEGGGSEAPMSVPARRAAQEAIRELLTTASSSSVGELRRELKAKKLIHLSAEETTELIAELIRRTPAAQRP